MNPASASVSTTSIPSPQMVTPQSTKPGFPDIAGYIKAAQSKGIPSDAIYSHLKELGYVDGTGKITTTKQSTQGGQNTFHTPLDRIESGNGKDNLEVGKGTVKQAAADVASAGAQNAGPVGKDMLKGAPDFAKAVEGFNTATQPTNDLQKEGARNTTMAEMVVPVGEGAKAAAPLAEKVVSGAANVASDVAGAAKTIAKPVIDAASHAASAPVNAAKDAATAITPTMQELIARAKDDPLMAKKIAQQFRDYYSVAEGAKAKTGAPTPLNKAAGQFKKAMTVLKSNMDKSGADIGDALKNVGGAKAQGVGDVLKHLLQQTEDRIGARYTPFAETTPSMEGMNFEKRVAHLNDIIDGKIPSPFEEEKGVFHSAPGREITINQGTDLKKLADLHETIANLGDSPTVQQLNDVVQRFQGDLYKMKQVGAAPVDSSVKGLMKEITGALNEKAKEAATTHEHTTGLTPGTYADAKTRFSDLTKLREEMSRRLGVNYKNAPSLIKSISSPQNRDLNKYIGQLEGETKVPIFDHATMADYVMRSVGDPRIKSMLETIKEVPTHSQALTARLLNLIEEHLKDPKGKVLRSLGQE